MSGNISKKIFSELLQSAGITINGNQSYDITIHNEKVFDRVLHDGALGLGESYMERWWECVRLDEFICRIVRAKLPDQIKNNYNMVFKIMLAKLINFQTKQRAFDVGKLHYDLGNFLFEHMLDKRMVYTCGYWKHASTLEEAQLAKLELVCHKLKLKPGMRLLDIGCGWGALAKHAAEHYDVEVVGVTISKEQQALAKQNCRGLPVDIRLQDYRDINEKFDRIASLGMFEHVGHLNYRTYMEVAHRCLADDGLFLLHTIRIVYILYKSTTLEQFRSV